MAHRLTPGSEIGEPGWQRLMTRGPRGMRPRELGLALLLSLAVVLPFAGETSIAANSPATWTKLTPATSPPGRSDASMAFDASTGQLILFGGYSQSQGSHVNDTWNWDGSTWTKETGVEPFCSHCRPDEAAKSSMAFDPSTGQLLLFGGLSFGQAVGGTYVWNGEYWKLLHPPDYRPRDRWGASMAFDYNSGNLILFGGKGNLNNGTLGNLGDTWSWDGEVWKNVSPPNSPPNREGASMAYDHISGRLILVNGTANCFLCFRRDTWAWDGSTWTQLFPANSPSARSYASMAYDPATGQLVYFGGESGGRDYDDTWVWDGSNWHEVTGENDPPTRAGTAMAFDQANGQMVLFGGNGSDDTWVYSTPFTGTNWYQRYPVDSPTTRFGASSAFDHATGQYLLFGGYSDIGSDRNDTWSWDGSTWTQLSPPTRPPVRTDASMAFDQASSQFILFGGSNTGGIRNDTWVWDGSDWTELLPATRPPARTNASMAFDQASGQLLMFGGSSDDGTLKDTWTWDGSNWIDVTPNSDNPDRREGASMAFDAATGQLILYGGWDGDRVRNDTWTWDDSKSKWNRLSPDTRPGGRKDAAMAFNPAIGQLILFGGSDDNGFLNDTWTWDGANWAQISFATSPPGRANANLDFDLATGQLILFGGSNFDGFRNDTWQLGLDIGASQPVTTASATNANASTYSFGAWTNQPVTISLSTTADVDDVTTTYYTIDGVQYTYAEPFTISDDGDHTVAYWSASFTGKEEPHHSVQVIIDSTAPTTSASATQADNSVYTFGTWTHQAVTISLSSTDGSGSGLDTTFYTIDGVPNVYSVPFTISDEGDHIISFWSTDALGNSEERHYVHVMIAPSGPLTSADAAPYTFGAWTNQPVTVTLSAVDDVGDIEETFYTIDGEPFIYSVPFAISTEGDHFISYWSTDSAGNVEEHKFARVMIDMTPPVAGHSGPFAADEGTTISLDGSGSTDALSGVASTAWEVSGTDAFDDGDPVSFTPPDGPFDYPVRLKVTDVAGNETIVSTTVTAVNVPPTINALNASSTSAYGQAVIVVVAASDPAGSNDPLTYAFDCDGDGIFELDAGNANSATCFLDQSTLTPTVAVQVSDDDLGVAVKELELKLEMSFCASIATGRLRNASQCGSDELEVVLRPGVTATFCASSTTGALHYRWSGQCSPGWYTLMMPSYPMTVCESVYTGLLSYRYSGCTSSEIARTIPGI